ncbi:hypothetical protein ACRYCC_43280 [Actinomadura scrupuli]|uniref:hypothetical protein n=1 Tax=Actinomadura scrupuli TaxID=559629 RepID=UPI003D97CCA9
MWLNVFIMGFASLFVGFILGWIMGRPRRWDRYVWDAAPAPASSPRAPSVPISSEPASSVPASSVDGLAPLPPTVTTHG